MRVVIVTENKYPCEDAGAIRQHATAKLFEKLGYSVVVLGYGKSTHKKILSYDGIDYISFRPKSNNLLVRILYRLSASFRMFNYLNRNIKDATVLLVADASAATFKRAVKFGRKRKCILVHDSVEWFSPEQFDNGEKSLTYKMRDKINANLVDVKWRVVAISSYLERHFEQKCRKIKFAYVGSPGKKDYLKNILESFEMLSNDMLKKIELHIVGVSEEQLVSVCGVNKTTIERIKDVLYAHGRLPHSKAVEFVRNSDFTILLRDETLRYAKAGFPTKIVESLSCGTPPVCNLSSDLGIYLNDGKNAIISNGHSPVEAKNAIVRALSLTVDEREKIRIEARKTAEQYFDFRNYVDKIYELTK